VKAHVHTDDPGRALALGTAAGDVEEIDIKNMHVQTAQRTQRLGREAGVTGAVAVVVGDGNRRLFESLGAVCVDGGDTMNPSTADIAAAIESLPESGGIVLPNSRNVVLAAEQAAEAVDKDVRVVPTHTLQAGLGALVAYDAQRPVDENAAAMEEAAAEVLTILLGKEAGETCALVEGISTAHPKVEVEVHEGGQPHYPLLFGAE
jgi:uncharacterized protein